MTALLFILTVLCAVAAQQQPVLQNVTNTYNTSSFGGNAICTVGIVTINVSTTTFALNITAPSNQSQVTPILNGIISNTTNITSTNATTTNVATYNISVRLCAPLSTNGTGNSTGTSNSTNVVQILVHGIGFDSSYWDFASNYSYIDQAAQRGYYTFAYDRLANGNSSKPNPITAVQAPTEVAILSTLINYLRTGYFGTNFTRVVGVGHSYGSQQLVGLLRDQPSALDAVALTGFSASNAYIGPSLALLNLTLSNTTGGNITAGNSTSGNSTQSLGYLTATNATGFQQVYFFQSFDPTIEQQAFARAQPVSLGTLLTTQNLTTNATQFTGPVLVLAGNNDYFFCGGNCTQETNGRNLASAVQPIYFPRSTIFQAYLVNATGHAAALHTTAVASNSVILDFIGNATSRFSR